MPLFPNWYFDKATSLGNGGLGIPHKNGIWLFSVVREIRKDEEAYGSQIDFFVRKEKIKSKVSI